MPHKRKKSVDAPTAGKRQASSGELAAPALDQLVKSLNDGGKSRKDWKSRPISSLSPVLENVWICNFAMSKALLGTTSRKDLAVVNVRNDANIADRRAINGLGVDDSMCVEQSVFDLFTAQVAETIEKAAKKKAAVFVNCSAGINRASAAIASWMVTFKGMRYSSARKLLHAKKSEAARFFNCKNAYQCWEGSTADKFSWPTLQGDGSAKLIAAVRKLEK